MPSGRKTIQKSLPYRSYSVFAINEEGIRSRVSPVTPSQTANNDNENAQQVTMPKHIPIPEIPSDGDLLFESIVFFYSLMALGLQYVNLYKTVWWLPHSHVKYAMNFYLIDSTLTEFILIVLSRHLLWCLFKDFLNKFTTPTRRRVVISLVRISLCLSTIFFLSWCAYRLSAQYAITHMLFLLYPITIIYFILNGTSLSPFFELLPIEYTQLEKSRSNTDQNQKQQIRHTCYLTAEAVREEADQLRANVNDRFKSVLFNSFVCAYYTTFIPCCFAQSVVLYDVWWVAQLFGFTWFSTFMLHLIQAYPPYYCDVLHRSVLHLGRWQRIDTRNSTSPWSESSLWQQGALVRMTKELYRAEGIINAAEPGNTSQSRFYAFFINPSTCLCCLLALQFIIIISQVYLLFRSSEWNRVITIALLLFCNYYTLFKLFRDYLVLWKIYRAEQLIQQQMTT